jgi:hypothetical protein
MEDTLLRLIRDRQPDEDVNTIHGYSPLWIAGVADFYRHSGDRVFLESLHPDLLQILSVMNAEFDSRWLFDPPHKRTIFVDWSERLQTDTPEARRATHLEFALGYREAIFLLDQLGDRTASTECRRRLWLLTAAAQKYLRTPGRRTFGNRWQTNAMAIVSGVAGGSQYAEIWRDVLSRVGSPILAESPEAPTVSPYYGFYILEAMAQSGHTRDAIDWMRSYWGGMLAEGATGFWEVYDPRWPKKDFHSALQADGKVGYYASLAHGWSSGPTPWLLEHILGIQPTGPGFSTVLLHPDLAGLEWAEGSEPTPYGELTVRLRRVAENQLSIHIDLPANTSAKLLIPVVSHSTKVRLNGELVRTSPTGDWTRVFYALARAGSYDFTITR